MGGVPERLSAETSRLYRLQHLMSIDAPSRDSGITLGETAPDESPGPEQQALRSASAQEIREMVAGLDQRLRPIVEDYFGFAGDPLTTTQIAVRYGTSRRAACNRLQAALRQLSIQTGPDRAVA